MLVLPRGMPCSGVVTQVRSYLGRVLRTTSFTDKNVSHQYEHDPSPTKAVPPVQLTGRMHAGIDWWSETQQVAAELHYISH